MKFLHVSDLHLGKRLYETSLIEDQRYVLNEIVRIVDQEKPNAILIAGDVYDKSTPSAEAVALFDYFICELAKRRLQTFIISGNHDSAERIAFGGKIMGSAGIRLSPVYNGEIKPITLEDEHGEVDVYMLPFVKPAHVRRFFDSEIINTYTDAVRVAINKMDVDVGKRNVLVAHQFVTGATRSESEETVGGIDNVDSSVFEKFDYVALGHLHKPQFCDGKKIRYSGTPLKYSFSEVSDVKSVTCVTMGEKGGQLQFKTIELKPMRDMKKVRGEFDALMSTADRTDDYVQITLTDENDVPNAMSRLQTIFTNALELRYDNTRTRANGEISGAEAVERKTSLELFSEFFGERNNSKMSDEQKEFMKNLIDKIEGESL